MTPPTTAPLHIVSSDGAPPTVPSTRVPLPSPAPAARSCSAASSSRSLANPLARASRKRRREWPSRDEARDRLRGRGTYRGWTEPALDAFATHALRDTPTGSVELKCAPALEATIFSTMPSQLWPRMRRIPVPTLLLHGRETMPFVAVGCARAHRHNPSHVQVQVTAGGHCFMQQDPADAAARVKAHLLG